MSTEIIRRVPAEWLKRQGDPPERKSQAWDDLVAALEKDLGREVCGAAVKRDGKYWPCTKAPVPGSGQSNAKGVRPRCRWHGGHSLAGPAHPRWVDGSGSYFVPRKLRDTYERVLNDPDYISLRKEIALIVARQQELLNQLEDGESESAWQQAGKLTTELLAKIDQGVDHSDLGIVADRLKAVIDQGLTSLGVYAEIRENADLIRRLTTAERQRLEALQQTVTAERGMALVASLLGILRRHLTRDDLAKVMLDIQSEQLISGGDTIRRVRR